MTLVCHPTGLGSMVSNPDQTFDIICELEFFRLQRMKKWSLMTSVLSLIHISEPTRLGMISYAVFCLKKK